MNQSIADVPQELRAKLASPHVPQDAMAFDRVKWSESLADIAGVTLDFEALTCPIDRAAMCRFVDNGLKDGKVVDAFIAVMIWGYGKSARGRSRTRLILIGGERDGVHPTAVNETVIARLTESARLAREKPTRDAYHYLNNADEGHIKQFGPSFFTKWLYATSSRGDCDSPQAAPILDKVVLGWLNTHARTELRRGYTDDYARYIKLLTAWGGKLRTPAQTEQAIFEFAKTGH